MTLTETLTMSTRFAPARRYQRGRRAFSLVELLVVIGIIISLVALTGVALQKTVESQKYKTTQEQLTKTQTTINVEYGKIVSEVSNAPDLKAIVPPAVLAYCDNDLERARAVWLAMRLRQQFPQSFAEATQSLYISDSSGLTTTLPTDVKFTLKPLMTFAPVQGVASGSSSALPEEAAADESGALLYLILVEKSNTGSALSASGENLGASKEVNFGGKTLRTFVDSWGHSIGFQRWYGSGTSVSENEIQDIQYRGNSPGVVDILDPKNKVTTWTNTAKLGQVSALLAFNNRTRLATNYSLARSLDKYRQTPPTPILPAQDYVFGFRLNRPGITGRATP